MRTSKSLASLLVLALVVAAAVGAEPKLSNTKTASCMVRITADAGILPLNLETVESLVSSSAVAGKAAREVLALDADAAAYVGDGIQIDWLSETFTSADGRPEPALPRPGEGRVYDEEMMRQMEPIYREEYSRMMGMSEAAAPGKKDKAEEKSKADSLRPDRPSGRDRGDDRAGGRTTDRSAGGYGGGVGMGGYGAMMDDMYGGMGPMRGMGSMGGMSGRGGMYGMGGTYGMGGMYGMPTQPAPRPGTQQSVTIQLSINLPDIEFAADTQIDAIKPAATEFMNALVDNLRAALQDAFEKYAKDLDRLLSLVESRRQDAETRLETVMGIRSPQRQLIQDHLGTIVDLSMLSPGMPFSEALEHLVNAVEPPLQIVVLWKELNDSCEIGPNTAIDMDGLPHVKLETALRTLLEAVSGGLTDISYQIDDDVIIIREEESQTPRPMPTGATFEADVRALHSRSRELTHQIQSLELDLAGWEARREMIQRQMAIADVETAKKLQEDTVTRELEEVVEMQVKAVAHLEGTGPGHPSYEELTELKRQLAQARIELARRREELSKSVGGGQLDEFSSELTRMAVDTAEKKAQLDILRRQLEEVRLEVAQASRFDPQAARLRMAKESQDIAERRVAELKLRLANLQPPTVTMIGGLIWQGER